MQGIGALTHEVLLAVGAGGMRLHPEARPLIGRLGLAFGSFARAHQLESCPQQPQAQQLFAQYCEALQQSADCYAELGYSAQELRALSRRALSADLWTAGLKSWFANTVSQGFTGAASMLCGAVGALAGPLGAVLGSALGASIVGATYAPIAYSAASEV